MLPTIHQARGPSCSLGRLAGVARSHLLPVAAVIVQLAWGGFASAQCPGDINGDRQVTVDEVVTAVDNALNGCTGTNGRFSGKWIGSFVSGAVPQAGGLYLQLADDGSRLTGDVAIEGSDCLSGGLFTGTVSGNNFSGSLRAGGIRVDLDGTRSSAGINGTYRVINGGACTGDFGTYFTQEFSPR